jgi:hypothetical protein
MPAMEAVVYQKAPPGLCGAHTLLRAGVKARCGRDVVHGIEAEGEPRQHLLPGKCPWRGINHGLGDETKPRKRVVSSLRIVCNGFFPVSPRLCLQSRKTLIEHVSACRIQALIRGVLTRVRFRQIVLDRVEQTRRLWAHTIISRNYRAHLKRKGLSQERLLYVTPSLPLVLVVSLPLTSLNHCVLCVVLVH